jgi:hypothetical protein
MLPTTGVSTSRLYGRPHSTLLPGYGPRTAATSQRPGAGSRSGRSKPTGMRSKAHRRLPTEQRVDREGPERGEDARTGPQERLRCSEEHGGSANEPGLLWGAQDLDGLTDGGPAT